MNVTATEIEGVYALTLQPHYDERGFFARIFCPDELWQAGVTFESTQMNLSRNIALHTLRGMHYQEAPFAEAKIVRAVRGAIFDVVVDLRPQSPTLHRWIGRVLDSDKGDALFLPEGCAHGFLTLAPDTDVLYQMGRPHIPGHARGFRYDDTKIGIEWPQTPKVVAPADESWPPL